MKNKRATIFSYICIMLINIVAICANAQTTIYKTPPFIDTYEKYSATLKHLGATKVEHDILITLATAETAGMVDVKKACALWGCDKKTSFSAWQIQCIDKPGNNWGTTRWLWYLRKEMKDPSLTCSDLTEDYDVAAEAALIILRAWGKGDPISLMLRWGPSPDKSKRIILLNSLYLKISGYRPT